MLACIAAGVPVTEGAIENVLPDFGDGAFDVVLLSWTLQTTRHPAAVVAGMMGVAPVGIVSFPNFAHWRLRAGLALRGRMPNSLALPQSWDETPDIHPCTLADFESLVTGLDLRVSERVLLGPDRGPAGAARGRAPEPARRRRRLPPRANRRRRSRVEGASPCEGAHLATDPHHCHRVPGSCRARRARSCQCRHARSR